MRKVIVSLQLSLDGFMATTDGRLDWQFEHWTEEMSRRATEQLLAADTIVLGRNTYEAMADYWPQRITDVSYAREDIAFAHLMNSHHKLVFSTTLRQAHWTNTVLVNKDPAAIVSQMKLQDGKGLLVLGSGSIVSALTKHQLVDEFILWSYPVILGKGKPAFRQPVHALLVASQLTSSGVLIAQYRPFHSLSSKPEANGNILAEVQCRNL